MSRRITLRYGPDRRQVGDLWLPGRSLEPVPVVVLVHGGFWRPPYTKRLLNRLAADVAEHGWAAWNVEYRRVGRWGGGGWPDPLSDVWQALGHLAHLDGVDLDRVAICGHSAGAQLAVHAAWRASAKGDGGPMALRAVVALAGLLDLVDAADRGLGADAVVKILGGRPSDVPERYAAASPLALLPLGLHQIVIHGEKDSVVPAEMSERYAAAAAAAGDQVVHQGVPGQGHLGMIDPGRPGWRAAAEHLGVLFGTSADVV